jgi:hypothetical protein
MTTRAARFAMRSCARHPHRSVLHHVRGHQRRYLPPDSQDFNPIENACGRLEALLRKAAARTVGRHGRGRSSTRAFQTEADQGVGNATSPGSCERNHHAIATTGPSTLLSWSASSPSSRMAASASAVTRRATWLGYSVTYELTNHHSPLKRGLRFSLNARMPSR